MGCMRGLCQKVGVRQSWIGEWNPDPVSSAATAIGSPKFTSENGRVASAVGRIFRMLVICSGNWKTRGAHMKTVLIIDDDKPFRALLVQHLVQAGWEVIEAEDGEEGLKITWEKRPEIVICDLHMPRSNGFHFCRNVRARRDMAGRIKIIITTGSTYATDKISALEAGADAYLEKPMRIPELLQLLTRWSEEIVGNGGGAELAPTPALEDKGIVRFWGVRGSISCPGPSTVYYGGNTSCVEVRYGDQIIVLDAGTGIRALGLSLEKEFKDQPLDLVVLISHTHWDHIQGFPFFIPAYLPKNRIRLIGFEGARRGLESILSSQMESPYFPVSLEQMSGNISVQAQREMKFTIGSIVVTAQFVNHPGVCVGYRLDTPRGSVAYLPDNEPYQRLKVQRSGVKPGEATEILEFARSQDQKIIEFIRDVDVLIIDAQYNDEGYRSRAGWGHGCVDDVVAIALIAKVKRLFLFHHDPDHDDAFITRMVEWARQLVSFAGEDLPVDAAREGLEVVLRPVSEAAPSSS